MRKIRADSPSFLILLLAISDTRAEDEDDLAWMQAFSGIGPYLIALFFIVFSLHVVLYPKYALYALMQYYINEGISIQGKALSSEAKPGSGGDTFIVEVMYEASEHKYADNPSMKFRNPGALEKKSFLRRFEFGREVGRGEAVEVLLPPGPYGTRAGCPREVVERLMAEYNQKHMFIGLFVAMILIIPILGFAIREVLRMENPSSGWKVLFLGIGVIEVVSFFYSADQFAKNKRRRFQSARPMLANEDAVKRAAEKASRPAEPTDPFKIPLHDFAGHARATEKAV